MIYEADISGLCPKKCSCDQCRAARKADPGYQVYLQKKWAKETLERRKKTIENAEAHSRGFGIFCNTAGYERQLRAISERRKHEQD